MKDRNHLSVWGVGPVYALICGLLTAAGIILRNMGWLDSGAVPAWDLPMTVAGFLLMAAVGMMTQTANIFGSAGIVPGGNEFNMVMMVNAIFAIVGSYVLGLLDTKIGTRKSMLIAMALMVVSGILGIIGGKTMVVAAMWILGIFMGASSNYTVNIFIYSSGVTVANKWFTGSRATVSRTTS